MKYILVGLLLFSTEVGIADIAGVECAKLLVLIAVYLIDDPVAVGIVCRTENTEGSVAKESSKRTICPAAN